MNFHTKQRYIWHVSLIIRDIKISLGKDDYAYTKITTITPQYVIVNNT